MAPLRSFVVEDFGGLNLRDDPQQIGAGFASSTLNTVPGGGMLRSRPGFDFHVVRTDVESYSFLYALPSSNRLLAGYSPNNITVYNADGTVNSTAAPGVVRSATDIATLAQSAGTYVGISGVAARFISTAGAISAPAFVGHTPSAGILGTTPKSYRLVSTDGAHTVWFSNSGDPLTFAADNNVPLWPNDGETITWIAAWKDLLFVFKRTKFAVFWAENPDNDGTIVFEFRGVFNVPSLDFTNGKPVAVGREGVYYISRTGVYVTTGDTPRRISGVIDPLFLTIPDGPTVFSTPGGRPDYTLVVSYPWLHYDQDFLYVAYPGNSLTTASPYMAVLDLRRDMWSQWNGGTWGEGIGIAALASQPVGTTASTRRELLAATPYVDYTSFTPDVRSTIVKYTNTSGIDSIQQVSGVATTSDVSWSYTSGYSDLGVPGEKRLRYTDVYGSQTLSMALRLEMLGTRAGAAIDGGTSITLGTLPTVARARRAGAGRLARLYAHTLTGSRAAAVTRLEHRFTVGGAR